MIGLLTASGSAERWGGYIKELLPVDNRTWLLDRMINKLSEKGCSRFVITTTPDKIHTIANHLSKKGLDKNIAYCMGGITMWESIRSALLHCSGDRVLFAMPDTIVDFDESFSFPNCSSAIEFGMFHTTSPSTCSVWLEDQKRFMKSATLPVDNYLAWGVVSWSPVITDLWITDSSILDFDGAFSLAANNFSYSMTKLHNYVDMANWKSYKEYISK